MGQEASVAVGGYPDGIQAAGGPGNSTAGGAMPGFSGSCGKSTSVVNGFSTVEDGEGSSQDSKMPAPNARTVASGSGDNHSHREPGSREVQDQVVANTGKGHKREMAKHRGDVSSRSSEVGGIEQVGDEGDSRLVDLSAADWSPHAKGRRFGKDGGMSSGQGSASAQGTPDENTHAHNGKESGKAGSKADSKGKSVQDQADAVGSFEAEIKGDHKGGGKHGGKGGSKNGKRDRSSEGLGGTGSGGAVGILACAGCRSDVADLSNLRFVQHKSIGRCLLVELNDLRNFRRTEHPDACKPKMSFKTGKLRCFPCEQNLGNVQNNIGVQPWTKRDVGLLKFNSVVFVVPGERIAMQLSADHVAKVIGFKPAAALTVELLREMSERAAEGGVKALKWDHDGASTISAPNAGVSASGSGDNHSHSELGCTQVQDQVVASTGKGHKREMAKHGSDVSSRSSKGGCTEQVGDEGDSRLVDLSAADWSPHARGKRFGKDGGKSSGQGSASAQGTPDENTHAHNGKECGKAGRKAGSKGKSVQNQVDAVGSFEAEIKGDHKGGGKHGGKGGSKTGKGDRLTPDTGQSGSKGFQDCKDVSLHAVGKGGHKGGKKGGQTDAGKHGNGGKKHATQADAGADQSNSSGSSGSSSSTEDACNGEAREVPARKQRTKAHLHQAVAAERAVVKKVVIEKEFGFLAPAAGDGDVFFHFSRVIRAGGLRLCQGDEVEMDRMSSRGKPTANRVSAVSLRPRKLQDLEKFIHEADLENDDNLVSLSNSPAFWNLLARTPEIAWLGGRLLKDVCQACDRGQLRRALPDLLDSAMRLITQLSDESQVYPLLRCIASAHPERLARVLPRLRCFVRADAAGLELALGLAQAAAVACAGAEASHLSWQQAPLLPSCRELNGPLERPEGLPVARKEGGYSSLDELFDTIFTLEREDCFYPLRKSVGELLHGSSDSKDVVLYTMCFSGVVVSDDLRFGGVLVALRVRAQGRRRRQMLMFGSLLCVSLDGNFSKLVFLTVVQLQGDVLLAEICGGPESDVLCGLQAAGEMVAVESPVYYRAHAPVMRALQRMNSVPFDEELVHCKRPIDPSPWPHDLPASEAGSVVSLPAQRQSTLGSLISSCDAAAASTLTQLSFNGRILDTTQAEAVAHTLQNRVALIQGPPGTGKTLIGVVIIELLVALGVERILIVSYKNHILNEMLGLLLQHGVVRVGGGSTDSEALDARNLNVLLRSSQRGSLMITMMKDVEKRLQAAKASVAASIRSLDSALEFDTFTVCKFAGPGQAHSLLSGMKWTSAERKRLDELTGQIPDGIDVGTFLSQEYKDVDDEDGHVRHLADLQAKLRDVLDKSIAEWFPSCEFRDVQASAGKRSVLGSLPQAKPPTAVADDDGTDEDQEVAERMQCEARDKTDKDLLKQLIPMGSQAGGGRRSQRPAIDRLSAVDVAGLLRQPDLWELSGEQRALLCCAMLSRQLRSAQETFESHQTTLTGLLEERARLDETAKIQALQSSRIVGMTLDGQSINSELVERWQPQVVLVEESAECPIAKLLACMRASLAHFIQIGDPKQLPPQVNSHHLVRHNFAVSMMEWLMTGLPYVTLGRQSRMRTNFRMLMSDIYPALADNEPVVERLAPLDCIQKSVYWWTHDHEQQHEGTSFSNREEAGMVAQLVRFLLVQGVDASRVTVLASYIAQVRLLRQLLRDLPDFVGGEVAVQTIDKYQGSENDFVIVSLVRTGELRGFLGNASGKQRRCVAQSRARRGLYFVGDHRCFAKSKQWAFLTQKLQEDGSVGTGLPLICPRHPSFSLCAHTARQIPIKASVCGQSCGKPMLCGIPGHMCPRPCHGGEDSHAADRCRHFVTYRCAAMNHELKRRCCEDEQPCREKVAFWCPDGHALQRECSQAEADVRCVTLVQHECAHGHPRTVQCWQQRAAETVPACEAQCSRKLPCGHPCPRTCGEECLPANQCKPCRAQRKAEEKRAKEAAALEYRTEMERLSRELEEFQQRDASAIASKAELFQRGDGAAEYWEVHDKVMKYIVPQHNWHPQVTKIYRVYNPRQRRAFCEAALELFDPSNKVLKFHGCSREATESIILGGFRLPDHWDNMNGKGVYFASDSSKSARELYTKGSNMLLLCEVLLGKCWTVDKGGGDMKRVEYRTLRRKGFDSVFAPRGTRRTGGVENDEYIVYDPRQAVVKYVIHYEKTSLDVLPAHLIASSGTARHELKPKREFDPNNQLDMHFRVVESHFLRLCQRRGVPRTLAKVEYVLNKALIDRFEKKKQAFASSNKADMILAFHATKERSNIERILANNFDVSRIGSATDAGWYGRGFYFSEFPDVSLGYGQHLLLCRLLPGKARDLGAHERMDGQELTRGYDSHRVCRDGGGYGQELVIANPDQILPCYVLHISGAAA